MKETKLYEDFKKNAEAVSAIVQEATTLSEISLYAKNLLKRFQSGTETMIISLPQFSSQEQEDIKHYINDPRLNILIRDLDDYHEKIHLGITRADFGIADTGTLVIDLGEYNLRLTTMICEIHLCLLKKSAIRESAEDLLEIFNSMQKRESSYLSFITGASRTADIERVLVLGAHGPLELHILVQEEDDEKA